MTRKQVFNFVHRFDMIRLPKEHKAFDVKMALGINRSRLEPLYDTMKDQMVKVEKYEEYAQKYNSIMAKYTTKDHNGNPNVKLDIEGDGGTMVDVDDAKMKEYESAIVELNNEYKETFEEVKKAEADFQEYLRGEIRPEMLPSIVKIKFEDVPTDVYNTEDHFYLIEFMVE